LELDLTTGIRKENAMVCLFFILLYFNNLKIFHP